MSDKKEIPLPREHTCPKCGHYIWAHRISDDGKTAISPTFGCGLDILDAQDLYDKTMEEYRANATTLSRII